MKKLILLCSIIATFAACKKVENITNTTTPTNLTNGVHSQADFDNVVAEMTSTTNSRTSKDAINLSKNTINSLRNSITFDKQGVFHGFADMGNLRNELTIEQRVLFMEKITGNNVMILGKGGKVLGYSKVLENSNAKVAMPKITYDDKHPVSCEYSYDATCVR